ncbi:hypothetical protein Curi_c06600 [Gottschalkia acidurici 9a]|uniref:YhaN AAA domain-containing protein n=1 Tax=Gottschalkia acidurici (strain ATCC 7906 / DSM 604 / BCRC 14475 / CIP 104303 / KCTC 5404 / NCIMB 10678 / 9a) TaxID=1128398 RepID=K0AV45_GOTA9|nr:AAA family ATPase [Gottschalkia acidurici]AFS77733.1 hypothetical protein Curi_c06600 [Gottschalkia acidurici 9a]
MIIKGLILSSFGKFKGKKLVLDEGLNVVYGENEAGKTTIHKFIEGMFFGFFKPYSKRRTYTEEYNKYFPMDQNEYYGILKYKYNEKTYRIERNFTKENSDLKVFDDETGEDLTHMFEYDSVSRLHNPASIHMNLNRIVFKNTISVGQLDSKTDKELVKEVKDSLINLGGSLDEDISVKKVLEKLEKQINDIGTEKRVKTSPYGKIADEIAILENEKRSALLTLNEIDKFLDELSIIKIDMESNINKKNELKEELKKLGREERYRNYIDIKKLLQEIDELERETSLLSKYNEISTEDYTEIIKLNSSIESLKERRESLVNKERALQKEINLLNGRFGELSEKAIDNNIKLDLYTYEEIERELKDLKENNKTTDLTNYKEELKCVEIEKKKLKGLKIASLVILVAVLALGIINWKISMIGILFILLTIYCFKKEKELDLKAANTNRCIMDIETKEKEVNTRIENAESEMTSILRKYNTSSKIDLKMKIDEYDNDYELRYKYNEVKKQKEELKVEIAEINDIYEGTEENRDYILGKNKLKDIQEFKDALEKRNEYKNLITILDSKMLILKNMKENKDINELEKEFRNFDIEETSINKITLREKEDINKEISILEEDIEEKKDKSARLEEKIKNLQQSARNILYIEEDINKKENEKQKYEEELTALNLAKDTINKVSVNIQRDFSPKLNNIVSNILSSITNDKYKDVKIDENLNIKVVDTNDKLVSIENLSGGTIEQIYLSIRLGINDVINGDEKLPLILDDSFIQYDETRLTNILNFLYRESQTRQIIIFTCQKREKEVIDRLKIKHSFIEI